MTSLLEACGAEVIHFPMIETVAPDSWAALDAVIERLSSYDWLVFTSVNGVEFFFRRLAQTCSNDFSSFRGIQVCAIGAATAKALDQAGRKADLMAIDSKAEGLLDAILKQVGSAERLRGSRFLIPRARFAREVLPEELANLGAVVETVEAYQTVKPEADAERLRVLLKSQTVDVITFTSSSTVHNLIATVGETVATDLLKGVLIACIGPVTATTAQQYNLTNIVQPDSYTAGALVEAIVQAFDKR